MKRDHIDFFAVEDHQLPIHGRLTNWSLWVDIGWSSGRNMSPIWCLGRSSSRQWHEPALRPTVDTLDASAIEKAVAALPAPHRYAVRWCYVFRTGPGKARKALGVTNEGLQRLVRDGRQMLINRGL
jgi:DNA-directed RNA polymerase specialized sigma24 family protein